MKQFSSLLFLIAVLIAGSVQAQYTEVINSNRPGESQGAFSVGTNVLQLELVPFVGKETHDLLGTENSLYGTSYSARYGLLMERLEINWIGSFQWSDVTTRTTGVAFEQSFANFRANTLGAKYLVYDPYIRRGEEKPNIRSWKANKKFKWNRLIPAVAVYAGANINFTGDNFYTFPDEPGISPKLAVITQHNWEGGWVFVMNLIADKFTTDFPGYEGIFTLTHSITPQVAGMVEYQVIKSDIYSDNILRLGGAYLLTKDFQIDANAAFNFKDTPGLWRANLGLSYRFDWHNKDEEVRKFESGSNRTDTKKEEKGDRKLDRDNGGL